MGKQAVKGYIEDGQLVIPVPDGQRVTTTHILQFKDETEVLVVGLEDTPPAGAKVLGYTEVARG